MFEILLWASIILILFTFIGYPLSLYIINKLLKRENHADTSLRPYVSIIVPAHNEENVIEKKLNNLISLNYPRELMEIIISSDNSTDNTNEIVNNFIKKNKDYNIVLHEVKERKGKTNAQNEAVRIAKGEILVFSDANAILDKDAIIHLVSSFTSDDIIYVAGKLKYVNTNEHNSSATEGKYWAYDLFMRKMESNIKTITAGNGAIYAIRKNEYIEVDPIRCHDAAIPLEAALRGKRALYNEKAIAYEKAGETSKDEFKRKVRMFRGGIRSLYTNLQKYNFFKYGWFSYFYFGHRACRRALFIFHILCFVSNALLVKESSFYALLFFIQCMFYLLAAMKMIFRLNSKLFYYPYYYCMTLAAQLVGTYNHITGKSKPFWEKAESTR